MGLLVRARPVMWLLLLLVSLHTSALRVLQSKPYMEDREPFGFGGRDLHQADTAYNNSAEMERHHWWPKFGEEPWHLGYGALLAWVYRHSQAFTTVSGRSDMELQMVTHGYHTTPWDSNEIGWYEYQTQPLPMPDNLANISTLDHLPALKFVAGDMGYAPPSQNSEASWTISQPCPLALASSWDYDVVGFNARLLTDMATVKGANVVVGPSLAVMRSPYAGAIWESIAGEDPFLGGRLAGYYLKVMKDMKVICALKYFAFHDLETEALDAVVDDHTAHELYLMPWQMAIEMGLAAVMCSPKSVNGTPACENHDLLTRILKTELGFKGMVIAEPGAFNNSTAAFRAGTDLVLFPPGHDKLEETVTDDLRWAAENVIAAQIFVQENFHTHLSREYQETRYGCFPPNCTDAMKSSLETNMDPKMVMADMTVLLKNKDDILPLTKEDVHFYSSIVVLGRGAKMIPGGHHEDGDYFSGGGDAYNVQGRETEKFSRVLPLLEELQNRIGMQAMDGEDIDDWEINVTEPSLCVVATGAVAAEGSDRRDLLVDDNDLIFDVTEKCSKTVVLLWLPGPVLTPWSNKVDAIVASFYLGEHTAAYYASLLVQYKRATTDDRVSPSGKLPVSFPMSEDAMVKKTVMETHYEEHMNTGYRSSKQAAFPFGYGLSYAAWQYDNITTWPGGGENCTRNKLFMTCGCATIQVNVTNLSPVKAKQVIQVYVDFGLPDEPKLMLRGFQKTKTLQGHNATTPSSELVRIYMQQRDVSVYDPKKGWVPQKKFKVRVGTSSADILKVMDVESVC